MRYIKAVVCFGLFCFLSITQVKAFDWIPREVIKIMPTATPTPMIEIRPVRDIEMEIMPLSTATPPPISVVVTQIVTATPNPTASGMISPTIAQEMDVDPTAIPTELEEKPEENKIDLKTWFMNITLGLLVLIILIQIWPKKKV
jgi:hypothetical protein